LNDLLDAAKFTRGRIELQRVPLDLRTLTTRSVEQQSHLIEEKRQHLSLALPAEPIVVLGDADRLRQAIGNLLDNSSKYTPAGGSISMKLEAEGSETLFAAAVRAGTGVRSCAGSVALGDPDFLAARPGADL